MPNEFLHGSLIDLPRRAKGLSIAAKGTKTRGQRSRELGRPIDYDQSPTERRRQVKACLRRWQPARHRR